MKKMFLALVFVLLLATSVGPVFAQEGTILPQSQVGGGQSADECDVYLQKIVMKSDFDPSKLNNANLNEILACAISTGRIELWMLPYYILRLITILLGLAGLIAVLFLIVAGYQYLFGGISEEKEKAKKTIIYALAGLVVALLAWALINLVQLALTS